MHASVVFVLQDFFKLISNDSLSAEHYKGTLSATPDILENKEHIAHSAHGSFSYNGNDTVNSTHLLKTGNSGNGQEIILQLPTGQKVSVFVFSVL